MLEALSLRLAQGDGQHLPPFGGEIEAILLAPMQQQGPHQALQLGQMGRPGGTPLPCTRAFMPMAEAVALLEGPLILRQRMSNGGEQRKQLGRSAVLHRRPTQQPGDP